MSTDIIPSDAKDVTPLSAADKKALKKAEATIEAGMRSFVEVGNSLAFIRDNRLYRETHSTFEAYISERWHWERTNAYNYIGAAEVSNRLDIPLPTLRHAMLLSPFAEEKQRELAPLIADKTVREAQDIVRDYGRVPQEGVKAVQAMLADDEGETPAFAAFIRASDALDMAVLPDDELIVVADRIKKLAAAYNTERSARAERDANG